MRFDKILEKRWQVLKEQEGELPGGVSPEDAEANDLKGNIKELVDAKFRNILILIATFLESEKTKSSENTFSPLVDELIDQIETAGSKDDASGIEALRVFLKGKSEVSAGPVGIETGAPTPTYSDQEPQ